MAFIFQSIDKKPMRLKGVPILAGTATQDSWGTIKKGGYRGVRSGLQINVLSSDGVVFPSSAERLAFEATKPMPITLNAAASDVPDILSEVFVPCGEEILFEESVFPVNPLPKELDGIWIPVEYEDHCGAVIARGWIMQDESGLASRMFFSVGVADVFSIRPIYLSGSKFIVE